MLSSFRDPHSPFQRTKYRLSEWMSGYEAERRLFEERHGYPLDLENPRSFSEKICWRKLFDRNPLLPRIVDKYVVRGFVREILGEEEADKVLIPLLAVATDPSRIPFNKLPPNYIIKANHGSGDNLLVREDRAPDVPEIVRRCKLWLAQSHATYKQEWAYDKIRRRIVVEALVDDGNGRPVREIKLQMFHGKCVLIQVLNDGSWYDGVNYLGSGLPTLTYFTPDWKWLDISWKYYWTDIEYPNDPHQHPPHRLDEMIALAEKLAAPFDYIRVDLYELPNGIRFGELTPYHLSGHAAITPREFDFELGAKWRLPFQTRRRALGGRSF